MGTAIWKAPDPFQFYQRFHRSRVMLMGPRLKNMRADAAYGRLHVLPYGRIDLRLCNGIPARSPLNLSPEQCADLIRSVSPPTKSCVVTGGSRGANFLPRTGAEAGPYPAPLSRDAGRYFRRCTDLIPARYRRYQNASGIAGRSPAPVWGQKTSGIV